MLTCPLRGRSRVPRGSGLLCVVGCDVRRFGLGFGALQVRSDCFGLRAAAARTPATTLVALHRGLRTPLGAVRHRALGALFGLRANRRRKARFGDGVRDGLGDQLDRADGVVIARDRNGDEVGIRVRVHDRDDRDAKLVGFGDGDLLLLCVDDEHEARRARETPDAAQILPELVLFTRHHEAFLLRVVLPLAALDAAGLELLHALELLLDRLEVREQPTEPPLGDVHRVATLRFLLHDAGHLRLRAHEQDAVAARHDVAHQLLRDLELTEGLLKVDDVDPVALGENEAAHLGIPPAGLVSEVDASREELLEGGLVVVCHCRNTWLMSSASVSVSAYRHGRHQAETREACWMNYRLPLAELESLSCLRPAWLLPFDRTRVPCQKTQVAELAALRLVDLHDGARHREAQRTGLARLATAGHVRLDVEAAEHVGRRKRLLNGGHQRRAREVVSQRAAGDVPLARTGLQVDAAHRFLAASDRVRDSFGHGYFASLFLRVSVFGTWAEWGCSAPPDTRSLPRSA